jgi:hypothetical protein
VEWVFSVGVVVGGLGRRVIAGQKPGGHCL